MDTKKTALPYLSRAKSILDESIFYIELMNLDYLVIPLLRRAVRLMHKADTLILKHHRTVCIPNRFGKDNTSDLIQEIVKTQTYINHM